MNHFLIVALVAVAIDAIAPAIGSAHSPGLAGVGVVPGTPVRGIAVHDHAGANPGTFSTPLPRQSGVNRGRAHGTRNIVRDHGPPPRQANPGQGVIFVPFGGTHSGSQPPPYVPFGGAGSGSAGPPVPGGIGATRNVSKD
jgi:hypothetical protein